MPWNWLISSHARLISLAVTWVVFVVPVEPSWWLLALTGFRFIASPVQMSLNAKLGRTSPLERRDHFDWALFGMLVAAVIAVSFASSDGAHPARGPVLIPALALFTAIQLRQCRRSLRAHETATLRRLALARV